MIDRKASILAEAAEIAMDGWHSVEKAKAFACSVSDYLLAPTSAPAEQFYEEQPDGTVIAVDPSETGADPKQAWWAGARAGLGLPANTPRTVVAQHLASLRTLAETPPAAGAIDAREQEAGPLKLLAATVMEVVGTGWDEPMTPRRYLDAGTVLYTTPPAAIPPSIIQEIEYGRDHGWPAETLKRLESMAAAWHQRAAIPAAPSAGEWKCGNEFLPYHPSASHVNPDYRDGWNACYRLALTQPTTVQQAGHCERQMGCVCGGDTQAVRERCGNWVKGGA
jgi:hypothetical protein